MDAALVKIDVAAADLNRSVAQVFDLVDGGTLLEKGLAWVFNFANDPTGDRRDLRFWRPELIARSKGNDGRYSYYEIEWVIGRILPEKRGNFHAGEVDQLFQIRPRTRIDFGEELNGSLKSGRNFYSRDVLAAFLKRRWLGACYERQRDAGPHQKNGGRSGTDFHPANAAEERDNGKGQSLNKALSQSLKTVATAG